MQKFYSQVVKHRKGILICFGIAFVLCFFMRNLIAVNYDMNDYLPKDSASPVSLEVMEREFDGDIPNARVMVRDVTIPEALDYKEKLLAIEGVTSVTWLDDAVDVTIPLEVLSRETVETYYRDGIALFSVAIDERSRIQAVDVIREVIGEENAMSGSAVSTAVATTSTVEEIGKIAVLGVTFAFLVLLVTTTSWLEPVVILIGLGVAVVINAGTNLIFGEVSFVTNAAGNILQLAVSLDYSVFLLHRFEECRHVKENPEEAMVDALCKSTSSILSSGLTTVIGFLALVLMRFRIGPDLGLALAKGIFISLITVFIFMPALILTTYRLLDKTRHRSIMPSFRRFGKLVSRAMLPMVCVFAVLIIPAYLASNSNDFYYGSTHLFDERTKLGSDIADIEEVFGKSDTYILMVPNGSSATEAALSEELKSLPQIKNILSYVDTVGVEIPMEYLDTGTLEKLVSDDYSRMVLSVGADFEGAETSRLVKTIRETADSYYPGAYYLAGEGISTYDLMDTVTKDMTLVNLIAIGAVFFVLLITMKSVWLPAILVLGIETAIWINLAIPYFAGSTIFYIAYLIISSVQLGATVDYAILFTERYREFRQETDKKSAIIQTVSATTVSILTSGSVLTVVGFLLGTISTHGLLSQLGLFLGKGTLCSIAVVLFALPGLLYLTDGLIIHQSKKEKLKELREVVVK